MVFGSFGISMNFSGAFRPLFSYRDCTAPLVIRLPRGAPHLIIGEKWGINHRRRKQPAHRITDELPLPVIILTVVDSIPTLAAAAANPMVPIHGLHPGPETSLGLHTCGHTSVLPPHR
jgi:hypothetical protein